VEEGVVEIAVTATVQVGTDSQLVSLLAQVHVLYILASLIAAAAAARGGGNCDDD